MSEENVEVVRRAVEAYESEGLAGSMRYYAPEIEWFATPTAIDQATYRGHEGLRRLFGTFDAEFDELRFDLEELIEAGDQVIVTIRIGGQGRTSGASVDRTWSFLCSLRNGLIYRVRGYNERAEALEAAGLSE